jgi:hypothetical protein
VLYISPINETICRNGLVTQVQQWASAVEKTNSVLAGQMQGDVNDISKKWLPAENARYNLTLAFRKAVRFVFGYNGNADIAIYAKYRLLQADVHLDWVVGKPEASGRVDCGPGVAPLRSMMAFAARIGQRLNQPVFLLADTPSLITKYKESGWELTGKMEGSKEEMVLSVQNLGRPSTPQYKGQTENVHWVFSGEHTLDDYLRDGTL